MMGIATKEIEGPEIEAILGQGISIPPQPKVLVEIDALANKPRVNVKAIAALISKDPALLAGIFKVVNSPAMGMSRRVDSAETAITLLGLKQVTNLLKSIAIRQVLGGHSLAYEKFWDRSSEIADIAATVAQKRVTVCNVFPDQAYMAGLFHDCGVPVLMQRFPEYCGTLVGGSYPSLSDEDKRFHTDHCVVGYLVSKSWRLPEFIQRGIRFHHEIMAVSHPASTVVAILQISIHIYNLMDKNNDDSEWALCWQNAIDELGISAEGLREFEEDVLETLALKRFPANS
jgi:HD-like signal output (HDOD) protein